MISAFWRDGITVTRTFKALTKAYFSHHPIKTICLAMEFFRQILGCFKINHEFCVYVVHNKHIKLEGVQLF